MGRGYTCAGLKVFRRISILSSKAFNSCCLCTLSCSKLACMLVIAFDVMAGCDTQFVTLFSNPVSLEDRPANNLDIFTVSASNVLTCSTAFSFTI